MTSIGLILIGLAGALLAGTTAYFLFRRGPDAVERERRRRLALLATGRITGGEIDDVRGHVVCYSYEVGGVGYGAAQDLASFPEIGDSELATMSGSVNVRYDRSHPGNSIVHSESWSGLPWPASKKRNLGQPGGRDSAVSGAA